MRVPKTPAVPSESLQIISLLELIELHLDGGMEQPQLHEQLMRNRGRFGKSQNRWKQVRQIQIEVSEGLDEIVDGRGFGIRQIDLVVQLFTKGAPVELNEGMFLCDFADYAVGDASAFAEAGQMQLPHFPAAAHVVHQKERFPFAANESHNLTPKLPVCL